MCNLRDEARGRDCQVRLEGVCNGNSETTVLAHYRLNGISGLGYKPPDLIGAHACSSCHDAIDRRAHTELDREYVQFAHAQAVFRTQNILIKEGKVTW
jgi:hypothetical protein